MSATPDRWLASYDAQVERDEAPGGPESPPIEAYDEARAERQAIQNEPQISDDAPDPFAEIRASLAADLAAGPEAIDNAVPPQWISYPLIPVAGACLAAPGATGKTTLVLGEMVRIAAGLDLYGAAVDRPGSCVYVSAEDGATYPRYLLQRILAAGLEAGGLSDRAAAMAKATVRVVGWSRVRFGPVMLADERGEIHVQRVWPMLLELIAPYQPVYVTLDPSVLFGPGERHGNDAAAAFAALMHETAQQIGACVQTIDHVAQTVARNGIVDQYASRGGTGKVDESRLARQLVRVTETDEPLPLGVTAADISEGRLFTLHWTKPSYAPRPPPAWLRRRGHWFEYLRPPSTDEAAQRRAAGAESDVMRAEAAVLAYVRDRATAGDRLGKRDVERSTIVMPDTGKRLPVREAAEAVRRLLAAGKLVRKNLPADDQTGFRKDYIDAA